MLKSKKGKFLQVIILLLSFFVLALNTGYVHAQQDEEGTTEIDLGNDTNTDNTGNTGESEQVNLDTTITVDEKTGLQKIEIPFFGQPLSPGGEYATLLSWVSFGGVLVTMGMLAFWVFLLGRAGLKAMWSDGNEDVITEQTKKAINILKRAAITFAFPVALTIAGVIAGTGPLWSWPKAFRDCPNSNEEYNFYFQALLDTDETLTSEEAEAAAEEICYGTGSSNIPCSKLEEECKGNDTYSCEGDQYYCSNGEWRLEH